MKSVITSRDVSLLLDVYKYRYLSVSQVEKLRFPSKRTAYRRLQALTTQGYLKAFTVPNIPERVYFLDKPGAEVVAGELHVPIEELQWHRYMKAPKDYYFLRHFLAINDFRILVTQTCSNSPVTLAGFIPEYVGEKVGGNVKKYIRDKVCDVTNAKQEYSHTPDAVFALEKEGKHALFFLEIDRGTEIMSDPEKGFLKSIVFYLNYWIDGKYQRFADDFQCSPFKAFRVLIVTTSGERIKNMRSAVSSLPFPNETVKQFFWTTTERRLTRDGVFGNLWVSLNQTDQTVYHIG